MFDSKSTVMYYNSEKERMIKMQLRLKDMKNIGNEPSGKYSVYVVNYRSDYDIVKLLEDLLNSNAYSFSVSKNSKQVRAMLPKDFELKRVL